MFAVFYKILYILTGVDYGFFEFKTMKIRVIVYCLSVIQVVTISIACVLHTYYYEYYDMLQITGIAIITIQHLVFVSIFMSMDKRMKLSGCLPAFKNVDLKLKMDSRSANNFKTKNLVFVFSILVYRIILTICYCLIGVCHKEVMKSMFYFLIYTTKEIIMFNNAYLLYQIKSRLVRLAMFVETGDDDLTDSQLYHRLYMSIYDICLQVKRAHDPVFITNLLGNMLDTMVIIYIQVRNMKLYNTTQGQNVKLRGVPTPEKSEREEIDLFLFAFLETLPFLVLDLGDAVIITAWSITTLLTFLPAILSGSLSTETELIISILHRKLLEERDMQKVAQIEKFISYIEARPLKFTVYNVIPLDAGLPGVILHVCVTYLIVVIQFSHLY